jgi:uncharacterized protein YqgV (UPF0045/DUF77 family)
MSYRVDKWDKLGELVARFTEVNLRIDQIGVQMRTIDRKSEEYRRLKREYNKLWEQHRKLLNEVNEMLRDIKREVMEFKDRLGRLKEHYDITIYGFNYDITTPSIIREYKIMELLNVGDMISVIRRYPITVNISLLYFDPLDVTFDIDLDSAIHVITSLANNVKKIAIPQTINVIAIDARRDHSIVGSRVYFGFKPRDVIFLGPHIIMKTQYGMFLDVVVL